MSKVGTIKFYGEVGNWRHDGRNFSRVFEDLEKENEHIIIRLHSYGGDVFEGSVIYNIIAKSSVKTTIIIEGVAASMAAIIMLAADEVHIAKNAFVMIHAPSSSHHGGAKSFENTAKLLRDIETNFVEDISKRTNNSEEAKTWMDGNDYWFSAKEAIEKGLADKITETVAKDIKDLDVKTNAKLGIKKVYDCFAAKLIIKNELKETEMDKLKLIIAFGLTLSHESSDTAVLDAALEKLNAEKSRANKAEAKVLVAESLGIKAIIDDAVTAGTVKDTDRELFTGIGKNSGIEALKAAVGVRNIGTRQTIVSQVNRSTSSTEENRASWTWADYVEKDNEALETLAETNFEVFSKLYEAEFKVKPKKQ